MTQLSQIVADVTTNFVFWLVILTWIQSFSRVNCSHSYLNQILSWRICLFLCEHFFLFEDLGCSQSLKIYKRLVLCLLKVAWLLPKHLYLRWETRCSQWDQVLLQRLLVPSWHIQQIYLTFYQIFFYFSILKFSCSFLKTLLGSCTFCSISCTSMQLAHILSNLDNSFCKKFTQNIGFV